MAAHNKHSVQEDLSLIWYTAHDEQHKPDREGYIDILGTYKMTLYNQSGTLLHKSHLCTKAQDIHMVRDILVNGLRLVKHK